jgi:hypothetical protein
LPDFAKNEIDESLHKCKIELSAPEFPTVTSVYNAKVASYQNSGLDLIKKIPDLHQVKSTLYRSRNAAIGLKKIVCKNLTEVKVPEKYSEFLMADYSYEGKRILIFATEKGRQHLSEGKLFFGDGTFKSCSEPFKQLYSIHCAIGEENTNIVPVAYALLSDKSTDTYEVLFHLLKAEVSDWTPEAFKTDFEVAVMKAILSVFPNVITKGCYFHYSQAVWKKGKELQLTKLKSTRRQVALSAVLPLLPQNEIFNGWWYVAAQSPDDKNSKIFRDYMFKQWLRDDFINVWCVFGQRHRTTNSLEAWHSKLNKTIKKKQPNMIEMLKALYTDASYYKTRSIQIENKIPSTQRHSKEAMLRENFIQETTTELVTGQISVGHFLEKMR